MHVLNSVTSCVLITGVIWGFQVHYRIIRYRVSELDICRLNLCFFLGLLYGSLMSHFVVDMYFYKIPFYMKFGDIFIMGLENFLIVLLSSTTRTSSRWFNPTHLPFREIFEMPRLMNTMLKSQHA